ncbi:MAG: response regulator transcription factor [Edaphobacter sp.]
MTILIVDDNDGIRRLLRRLMGGTATDIWDCNDGIDALAAYADHRPDVVLMDIQMPRMDGLAATRQIRQLNSGARVVIVTDYDDEQLRLSAMQAGACAYALKEDLTDLTELVTLVARSP